MKRRKAILRQDHYDEDWVANVRSIVEISPTGCWLLHKAVNQWGYAAMQYRGRAGGAHRRMYMIVHGVTLTRDQYVCHTCDVRNCCNPDHLWLGTNSENQLDASRKGRHSESRTACARGHEYVEGSFYTYTNRSGRISRACRQCIYDRTNSPEGRAAAALRQLAYRARKKAKELELD